MAQRTIEQQLADIDKKREELLTRQGERVQTKREKLVAKRATVQERHDKSGAELVAIDDELALIDREILEAKPATSEASADAVVSA